jgi:hypothetical protein
MVFLAVEITASTVHPLNNDFIKIRNQTEEILSRHRRFLVFPGGGFARFAGGFLVPTDIPLYQNINALNNINWFYALPPNIVIFTLFFLLYFFLLKIVFFCIERHGVLLFGQVFSDNVV